MDMRLGNNDTAFRFDTAAVAENAYVRSAGKITGHSYRRFQSEGTAVRHGQLDLRFGTYRPQNGNIVDCTLARHKAHTLVGQELPGL